MCQNYIWKNISNQTLHFQSKLVKSQFEIVTQVSLESVAVKFTAQLSRWFPFPYLKAIKTAHLCVTNCMTNQSGWWWWGERSLPNTQLDQYVLVWVPALMLNTFFSCVFVLFLKCLFPSLFLSQDYSARDLFTQKICLQKNKPSLVFHGVE